MPEDLTLTAALATAIAALTTAVGVLWRGSEQRHATLEKRTESHLAVATEQMKVLALMEAELKNTTSTIERTTGERTAQLNEMERKIDSFHETDSAQHAAQMAALSTIAAVILQRHVEPVVVASKPATASTSEVRA